VLALVVGLTNGLINRLSALVFDLEGDGSGCCKGVFHSLRFLDPSCMITTVHVLYAPVLLLLCHVVTIF